MKTQHQHYKSPKPSLGLRVAFKARAVAELAGVPAQVIYVWPRFRSGDYLVTLEYVQPVRCGNEFITRIDAFLSELDAFGSSTAYLA